MHITNLKINADSRGELVVIERCLKWQIKRVYFIRTFNFTKERGGHAHKATEQALVLLQGSFTYKWRDDLGQMQIYEVKNHNELIHIPTGEFHWMINMSKDCIILVLASENYNEKDYIYAY